MVFHFVVSSSCSWKEGSAHILRNASSSYTNAKIWWSCSQKDILRGCCAAISNLMIRLKLDSGNCDQLTGRLSLAIQNKLHCHGWQYKARLYNASDYDDTFTVQLVMIHMLAPFHRKHLDQKNTYFILIYILQVNNWTKILIDTLCWSKCSLWKRPIIPFRHCSFWWLTHKSLSRGWEGLMFMLLYK